MNEKLKMNHSILFEISDMSYRTSCDLVIGIARLGTLVKTSSSVVKSLKLVFCLWFHRMSFSTHTHKCLWF